MTFTIHLPWPDSRLSPNARNNRLHVTKQRRDARNAGYMLALAAARKANWSPADAKAVRITYTFHPPDRRHRDLDNLHSCLKAAGDGVAKAIGIDDAKWREVTLRMAEPTGEPGVTMEIGVIE